MNDDKQGSNKYNFKVFGVTRPGFEPSTSSTPDECYTTVQRGAVNEIFCLTTKYNETNNFWKYTYSHTTYAMLNRSNIGVMNPSLATLHQRPALGEKQRLGISLLGIYALCRTWSLGHSAQDNDEICVSKIKWMAHNNRAHIQCTQGFCLYLLMVPQGLSAKCPRHNGNFIFVHKTTREFHCDSKLHM